VRGGQKKSVKRRFTERFEREARAMFAVAAPGRLIVPVWSGTSNLWLGRVVQKR
jgi:hypothetical protein